PINGYLSGVSDVIQAQGQYYKDYGQARIINQQAEQAKLDTRRKQFDQRMYEQSLTPTVEELRQREQLENLKRSMNDPPRTEIYNGKALNDILNSLQKSQSLMNGPGPLVPLDPQTVSHINLAGVSNYTGAGALQDLNKFSWPSSLRTASF